MQRAPGCRRRRMRARWRPRWPRTACSSSAAPPAAARARRRALLPTPSLLVLGLLLAFNIAFARHHSIGQMALVHATQKLQISSIRSGKVLRCATLLNIVGSDSSLCMPAHEQGSVPVQDLSSAGQPRRCRSLCWMPPSAMAAERSATSCARSRAASPPSAWHPASRRLPRHVRCMCCLRGHSLLT